jgi:hypothetical protein
LAPIVAILRRLASYNATISGRYRVEPPREFHRPRNWSLGRDGGAMIYRHTQRGTLILVVCLSVCLLDILISWRVGQWLPTVLMLVVMALSAILFSSLTVEIAENELRWYFGPGLWTYRLPLIDIADVRIVRNHWWNGWGIRRGAGFRLYNVSGLDAVELRLTSSDVRRIGTDDPEGLAAALRARRGLR